MKSNLTAVFDSNQALADALNRISDENFILEDISVIRIFDNDTVSGTALKQKPMDSWELASELGIAAEETVLAEEEKIPRGAAIPGSGAVPAGVDSSGIYDLNGAVTVSDNILVPGIGVIAAGGPVCRILASDPYNGLDKWLASISPSFDRSSILHEMLLKNKLILNASVSSDNIDNVIAITEKCGGVTVA